MKSKKQKKPFTDKSNQGMHARSGRAISDDPLVSFLYIIMRDGTLAPGFIEAVMENHVNRGVVAHYSNGWLANYCKDIAKRLRPIRRKRR